GEPAPSESLVAEPTSGLPPGRLVPLPMLPERRIRELEDDLATQLQITAAYRRATAEEAAAVPAPPASVSAVVTLRRDAGSDRRYVRLGHVILQRRLPQLWVQAFTLGGDKPSANPDAAPSTIDAALREIFAERSKIFARLRLTDLETTTIPLSYVDA